MRVRSDAAPFVAPFRRHSEEARERGVGAELGSHSQWALRAAYRPWGALWCALARSQDRGGNGLHAEDVAGGSRREPAGATEAGARRPVTERDRPRLPRGAVGGRFARSARPGARGARSGRPRAGEAPRCRSAGRGGRRRPASRSGAPRSPGRRRGLSAPAEAPPIRSRSVPNSRFACARSQSAAASQSSGAAGYGCFGASQCSTLTVATPALRASAAFGRSSIRAEPMKKPPPGLGISGCVRGYVRSADLGQAGTERREQAPHGARHEGDASARAAPRGRRGRLRRHDRGTRGGAEPDRGVAQDLLRARLEQALA